MNRITAKAAADYGFLYAPSEKRATEMANAQKHTHGFVLIGQADASKGLRSVIKEVMLDLECCTLKLSHDCKAKFEPNQPILFEATYRAKDHIKNGKPVYGILLTGRQKK